MKRLEVRCCCDASKILGHLEHPKLQARGDRLVWRWFAPATEGITRFGFRVGDAVQREIVLTVDEVQVPTPMGYDVVLAVKNNDYPLEDLRLIPGFQEVG